MRINKFDTLKAIAMVSIILLHARTNIFGGSLKLARFFTFGVLGASMYLFSFISGWMIKPGKWNWPKIGRLLVISIAANCLINFTVGLCVGHGSHYLRIAYSLWYIYLLIGCKIILPAFKRPWLAVVLSLALSWLSFLLPRECDVIQPLSRWIAYAPFFAVGYWIANDRRMAKVKEFLSCDSYGKTATVCLILTVCIGTYLAVFHCGGFMMKLRKNTDLIGCSSSTALMHICGNLLFALWCLFWVKAIPSAECALSRYGQRTLPVYLLHSIPIFACVGIIKSNPSLTGWRWRLLFMVLAVGTGLLFFSRPFNSLFTYLLDAGPKKPRSETDNTKTGR